MPSINFSNLTLEELNNLSQKEIGEFSEEQFQQYYKRSLDLGNEFMFNGKIEGDASEVFGTTTKRLRRDESGNWEVWQSGGLMPAFDKRPIMLDRERFAEKMQGLGASDNILKKFFQYRPDYKDW